jgi:hypothetical protein
LALKLREKRYYEKCFAFFNDDQILFLPFGDPTDVDSYYGYASKEFFPVTNHNEDISAPLWQDVIDWFETKYGWFIYTFRYRGRWEWKIDDKIGTMVFNKVENGLETKREALIEAIDYAFELLDNPSLL